MEKFLPKEVVLSEQQMVELAEMFNLNRLNIVEITHWNDENSPYTGVIFGKDNNNKQHCYPYDRNSVEFLKEYPEGKILDLAKQKTH